MVALRMLRGCLLICALLIASSCKGQKNKAPDIENTPTPDNKAPDTEVTAPSSDALLDLHGGTLPTSATGRLGSLRMMDRSIRQMIFNAEGDKLISTHKDGYQIWNLDDASRGRVMQADSPGDLMTVSPDGTWLATTVDGQNEVLLWDLKSGEPLLKLSLKSTTIGLCFQGNKRLISASANGSITTWKLKSKGTPSSSSFQGEWTEATAFGCGRNTNVVGIGTKDGAAYVMDVGSNVATRLGTASKEIRAVAVASTGSSFAFGSADEHIYLWAKAEAGEPLKVEAHERSVVNLAFAPDNSKLYSTGGDWWFRIWNPETGELLEELPGAAGLEAQLMALSPDGNLMASWSEHSGERGSEAGRWWLWSASSGSLLLEPARHRHALTTIRYSPDGKSIATSSEDHTIRVWDAQTTKSVAILEGADGPIGDMRWSIDGATIFSAGKDAVLREWIWQSNEDKVAVEAVGGPVNRLVVSIDGKTAYTGDQIGRVWSWDLATGNQIQALDRQGYSAIYDLALSIDGKFLAIAGSARVIRIIDLAGGQEIAQLNPGDTTANYAVRFSADGKHLASAGDGHKIQIWNTGDWTRSKTYAGHDGTVRCLAYSPDGTRLVSGGNDELVKVWDTKTGEELVSLTGHNDVVSAVDVAPDGKKLVSASRDRTALLWEMP